MYLIIMKLFIKPTLNKKKTILLKKGKKILLIVNRTKIHGDSYFEMSFFLAAT